MGNCPKSAEQWLAKAQQDIITGRRMLDEPAVPAVACFHAQQAAEKALKALAMEHGAEDVPRIHSLLRLLDFIHSLGADIPLPREDLGILEPFAVHVRYPGVPEPDRDQAQQAVELAERVYERVREQTEADDHNGQATVPDP